MADPTRLYVQTLGQELPPRDVGEAYARKLGRLRAMVEGADAVALGIGSGVSTAAGYDFYHGSEAFDRAFGDFERAHGFRTLFDGLYHVFGTNEEQWAFNAAVACFVADLPLGKPYLDLAEALRGKDHFVLTTNIDGQASRAFGDEKVWEFQGDLRYVQCSQPCCDEVEDFVPRARQLVGATRVEGRDGFSAPRVPAEMLPRCPGCRRLMAPWARDERFLEGRLWREQRARYEGFLRRHLVERADRVLFLELGVSSMTPAVIKLPFWDMAACNSRTRYAVVNLAEANTPLQLGDRALAITADIARVATDLRR